ncbi:sensor histidine kinase [Brucella sp. NF 2653]|uniref:sensor histidine kinase n=1 Tax=unclassified Brucella TaxID=2632610 RepID=UPI0001BD8030|nr:MULTISPECIES: ATP-binding protein [unclassified Brucella]EEZ33824.1 periplasmic sensor signal transduction histidine kinase [Brucella sp. 83/13]EFM63845.1 sensor histidine kinase [Brucella sp. NF 2653]
MMRPRSLQWRISLWLGLGISLLWAIAALVTASQLSREMNVVFDSALEETAQRILPLAVLDITERESDDEMNQRMATLRKHDEYFTYVVRNTAGEVLLQSHSADLSIFPPFTTMGFQTTPTHRIYFDAALQGAVNIAVAEPLGARRGVAMQVLWRLALPLGLIIPLSLIGVWAIVRVSMAPLWAFRSDIEARGSGDLSPVTVNDLPSEVSPIAQAVNRLMDKLKRALEAERSFTANSAHELRTPIAAALAQTQRLIAETQDKAARNRGEQIEAALHRLSRLSEKLMQLAKAEGGRLHAAEPIDMGVILRMVVRELSQPHGNENRIRLSIPDMAVKIDIDADAFAILARNLIENALKHGPHDEPVEVLLTASGKLVVSNGGPAVPPDILERLAHRFERGTTKAEGTGLGLAIAKAIAAGTGGTIDLFSPREGRKDGFEVRFTPGGRVLY